MKKLQITLAPIDGNRKMNPIRKRDGGQLRYIYNVNGTPEQLAEYQKANPKAIVDTHTKQILFFSPTFVGKTAEILEGEKGWFVDTIAHEQFAAFCKEGGVEYAKMKMAELG